MTDPFGDTDFPNGFRELPELSMAEATGTALSMTQELKELKFKLQYTEGREKYWRKLFEELTTQRNHEVFLKVLELQAAVEMRADTGTENVDACVHIARAWAAAAYPPPPPLKDEP